MILRINWKTMGAIFPPPPPPAPKKKPTALFAIVGSFLLIVCALKWSDVVEYIEGERHYD